MAAKECDCKALVNNLQAENLSLIRENQKMYTRIQNLMERQVNPGLCVINVDYKKYYEAEVRKIQRFVHVLGSFYFKRRVK